jgi:diketogulonate reductase-like aldo/keto reductase
MERMDLTSGPTLPSGATFPYLGFGTWQITGDAAQTSTEAALAAGYRHVDTARMYRNEQQVGAALTDGVFVTTKIPPDDARQHREVIQESLDALGHVDLWLLHWPGDSDIVAVWRDMIAVRDEGLVGDIGVSNFSLAQLDQVTEATGVAPAVNQIPWSPYRQKPEVLQGHRDRGIVLEGYSGLKGGTLDDPVINQIAERLGRTPAQVIIRWHLAHEVVVIPKSTHPERIASNADLDFELSDDDVAALDALAR